LLQDSEIEAQIDGMVTGLFGVIATMGSIPILRAQPGGPAEMVASKLHKLIQVPEPTDLANLLWLRNDLSL